MAVLMETKTQPVPLGRIFCFGGESVGKLLTACSDCTPGAVQEPYKSGSFSSLSHPVLLPPSPWEEGESEGLSPPPYPSLHARPFVLHRVMGLLVMGGGRGRKLWHGDSLGLG